MDEMNEEKNVEIKNTDDRNKDANEVSIDKHINIEFPKEGQKTIELVPIKEKEKNIEENQDNPLERNLSEEKNEHDDNDGVTFAQEIEPIRRWDSSFFLISTLILMIIIFTQFDIPQRYKVSRALNKNLNYSTNTFYMSRLNTETANVYASILNSTSKTNFWLMDHKFEVVSPVRATLRKVKINNFTNPILMNTTVVRRAVDYFSNSDAYDSQVENSTNYGTFLYNIKDSYLGNGGFVFSIKPSDVRTNNGSDVNQSRLYYISEYFKYQYSYNVEAISSVTLDFTVVNYELSYVCPVIISFYYTPSGIARVHTEVMILDRQVYSGPYQYFRAVLEGIYLFMIIYYIFISVIDVRAQIASEQARQRNDYIKMAKVKQNSHNRVVSRFSEANPFKNLLLRAIKTVSEDGNAEGSIKSKEMTKETNAKRRSSLKSKLSKEINLRDTEDPLSEATIQKKIDTKIVILGKIIIEDIGRLIYFMSLIISVICMILWVLYVLYLLSNMNDITQTFQKDDQVLSHNSMNQLILAGQALEKYRSLMTLNFLLIFIRLIKIMSQNYSPTNIFFNAIFMAKTDLTSFFVIFLTLLFGHTIFIYVYFGRVLVEFNDFLYTLFMNLTFILGFIPQSTYNNMYLFDDDMTLVYFILVIFFMRFIVVKILLSIILHFFKISSDFYESKHKEFGYVQMSIEDVKKRSPPDYLTIWINYFKLMINKLCDALLCKGKDKQIILIKKQGTNASSLRNSARVSVRSPEKTVTKFQLDDVNLKLKDDGTKAEDGTTDEIEGEDNSMLSLKDISVLNNQYSENYVLQMRNPYFDSEKDETRLKKYYEIKYRIVFIQSILFLLNLGILIIMVFFNTLSPWHQIIHTSVGNALNKSPSSDPSLTINNITNIYSIQRYVFDGLPLYFNINPTTNATYFMQNNTLVMDSIFITTRRTKQDLTLPNSTTSRTRDSLTTTDSMSYENKTYYRYGDVEMFWTKHDSYRQLGGYCHALNLLKYNKTINHTNLKQAIIDPFTDFVILEFVLQNVEYRVFAFVTITITLDYGGYYTANYATDIIDYDPLNNMIDKVKFVTEAIYIAAIIYWIILNIRHILGQWKEYEKWWKDQVVNFTIKTRDLRDSIRPEVIRKIYYIFNMGRIIEVGSILLGTVLIIIRINLLVNQIALLNGYPTKLAGMNIYDFRNFMYFFIDYLKVYDLLGSIMIILLSFRLIIMINIGKYFTLLIRTLDESKRNNITFIIIILLTQPAFIFYGYLSFGEDNIIFYTLPMSIVSCFNILFGKFTFMDFIKEDIELGSIFFLLYLFFINMILLNLFTAVIYSSYTKVKDEIKNTKESYSLRRVLLFCCYKSKKDHSLRNKGVIDSEFDYNKPIPIFETQMVIHQQVHSQIEWNKHEVEQVKNMDDAIYNIKNKMLMMKFALDAKSVGSVSFLFDDNLYKDIEEKHTKCFKVFYLNFYLNLIRELEDDIQNIERYQKHAIEYKLYKNFEKKIENMKIKNDQNYEIVADLESRFMTIYDDLNTLKNLSDEVLNIDEYLKEQMEQYEQIKLNNMKNQITEHTNNGLMQE